MKTTKLRRLETRQHLETKHRCIHTGGTNLILFFDHSHGVRLILPRVFNSQLTMNQRRTRRTIALRDLILFPVPHVITIWF